MNCQWVRSIVFVTALLASGLWAGSGLIAVAAPPKQAGKLLDVRGAIERLRNQKSLKATSWMPLLSGDQLTLGLGARASIVLYQGGKRFTLSGPGQVTVGASHLRTTKGGAGVATFVDAVSLPAPPEPPSSGRILGDIVRDGWRGEIVAPSPRDTALEPPVTLAWKTEDPQVRHLILRLWRVRSPAWKREDTPILEEELPSTATRFTVPHERLPRGEWLVWTITAQSEALTLGSVGSILRILSQPEKARLEALESHARATPDDAAFQLLLADECRRLRLFDGAESALAAALARDSALAEAVASARRAILMDRDLRPAL